MEKKYEMIQQPEDMKVSLYPHQLSSIFQMEKREKDKFIMERGIYYESNIAVNADKTGYGKCHGIDTPILMYNGEIKKVQDVRVGDKLMGDDSTPRNVLSLARGREKMYKIVQSKSNDYVVNSSHILSLYISLTKKLIIHADKITVMYFDVKNYKIIKKNFLYEEYKHDKKETYKKANEYFITIPEINPKIDIHLKEYLKIPLKYRKYLKGYKGFVSCWEDNLTEQDIKCYDYGLKVEGFILQKYKINTVKNRFELLAGIIDSDIVFECDNIVLKEDIDFLCNSLNVKIFFIRFYSEEKKSYCYKIDSIFQYNNYEINLKNIKNREKIYTFLKNKDNIITNDIEVEELGIDNYYGFSLDNNHRYLLKDFTVTHNTLSMVTLIHRDKMEWDINSEYEYSLTETFCGGKIKKIINYYYEKIDVTLILANQSIINQWVDEIEKTCLTYRVISSNKLIETICIKNYDVILVTPTMYNKLLDKYRRIAWKRFIFDEPGHLKVPAMRNIIAGFIWFITATPDSIFYLHKNCKNSFMNDIVYKIGWSTFSHYYSYLIIKNDDNFIKESFLMPPTNNMYYKCYNPVYKAIKGFVTEKISEMISAGNIQGAMKELGVDSTGNITELIRNKKIEEIKDLEDTIKILSIRNRTEQIKSLKEKINRLEEQIKEIDNRYKDILLKDCNICLDKLDNPVMEPNCQNIFCGKCIFKWLENQNNCPLCRDKIDIKSLIYIDNKEKNKSFETETKKIDTKVNTVIKLIKNNEKGKFIIFSSWDETFSPIRNILIKSKIGFIEVKGSISSRQKSIDSFKNGDINVIFLNSKNNGSGINLQEATDLIIYHEMPSSTLSQIIGRANRIGRKESLNVHHLQI